MMDGSHGGSNSPAPFLTKTYDMLDDPSTDPVVSWSPSGSSFIVWNPLDFARDLLPVYFKHNNFSSFIRQLNTYGFRKIDPERWEFANDEFMRGQRNLLRSIHRRKPVHSHSVPLHGSSISMPLPESEKRELSEEIKILKHDKDALLIELEKLTQYQHTMDQHMQILEERLQGTVLRQRNLLSFMERVVQWPGFLSNLVQRSDLHNKKRRLPIIDALHEDPKEEDTQKPLLDIEPFERMESSLNSLETFFHQVGQASGEDAFCDEQALCLSPAPSGETDANLRSSSHSGPSSPEMASSPTRQKTTGADFELLQGCIRRKLSDVDMNLELVVCSRSETEKKTVPTGANDTFWEQFLTESPGYFDGQEAESERREADGTRAYGVSAWWNRKSVEHLAERMGHLTPAERT